MRPVLGRREEDIVSEISGRRPSAPKVMLVVGVIVMIAVPVGWWVASNYGPDFWVVFLPLDTSSGADGTLAWCGDGIAEAPEQCDGDGQAQCGQGQTCEGCQCVNIERVGGACGNSIVETGENCDGDDTAGCLASEVCLNCQCVPGPTSTELPDEDTDGCGDGYCNTAVENTDLCPDDCVCVDDGQCSPSEGANCMDCGDPAGACGARCATSDTCPDPLSCFNGVCWEACLCGGNCGRGDMECWCVGHDRHCNDGTVEPRGCYP